MIVYKDGVEKIIREDRLQSHLDAGWSESKQAKEEQVGEEVIRLKPPVKTKATVKTLEEANINKGDE